MEKRCLKAPRIILLHLELVTFRFGHGWDRKHIMFMISGFSDVSMAPRTISFILRDTRILQITNEQTQHILGKYYCCKPQNYEKQKLLMLGKAGTQTPDDPSNMFWRSVIWDQYRPESIKRKCGNMGYWLFEALKLWNFEALKQRNFEIKQPKVQNKNGTWTFKKSKRIKYSHIYKIYIYICISKMFQVSWCL